jgi:predicted transcriptional regulator
MHNALISIKPCYVENLISGKKTVEIRSRQVNLPPSSRLWIYSTRPKACVQAIVHVDCVDVGMPTSIWRKYNGFIGVSKDRFYDYVNGSKSVSAIIVDRVWGLPVDITLKHLKEKVPGFHPPQFLKYMDEKDPLLSAIVDFLYPKLGFEYFEKVGLTKLLQPAAKRCG